MAGKPRVTVRLEPSVFALLEWYAAGRQIPPSELAAHIIASGSITALADADLRAALIATAGPPPLVAVAHSATIAAHAAAAAGQQGAGE